MITHTIETINTCEQHIAVTVDAKTVRKTINAKLRTKAKNINRGGFRQNESTRSWLLANLKDQDKLEIQEELLKSFSTICAQEKISYEGMPILKEAHFSDDGSFQYLILIEKYPTILHVNWEGVALEKLETHITPEELTKATPLFKKMELEELVQSPKNAEYWCEWMLEVFQYQKLREQIIKALLAQNHISEVPLRLVEAQYQAFKQEASEKGTADELLREKARAHIASDILLRAYALEHHITLNRKTLLEKIEKAKHNPFIMSHVKEVSQLPGYLGPRVFEEAIIQHLTEHSQCTTIPISLSAFIAQSFNIKAINLKPNELDSL